MRETRQAVGSEFLGSLESFLVFLESLMEYCKLFLADTAAEEAMKARSCTSQDMPCCQPAVLHHDSWHRRIEALANACNMLSMSAHEQDKLSSALL